MLLDEEAKEAWEANIPAVLLEEDRMRKQLEPTTKEGIYNRVIVQTGDPDLAQRMANEFAMEQKIAAATAANG